MKTQYSQQLGAECLTQSVLGRTFLFVEGKTSDAIFSATFANPSAYSAVQALKLARMPVRITTAQPISPHTKTSETRFWLFSATFAKPLPTLRFKLLRWDGKRAPHAPNVLHAAACPRSRSIHSRIESGHETIPKSRFSPLRQIRQRSAVQLLQVRKVQPGP